MSCAGSSATKAFSSVETPRDFLFHRFKSITECKAALDDWFDKDILETSASLRPYKSQQTVAVSPICQKGMLCGNISHRRVSNGDDPV
jgi:hypothetical protein